MSRIFENVAEYILFTTGFVVVAFVAANFIDNALNVAFEWMQKTFGFQEQNWWWLAFEIVVQVLITGIVSFQVRDLITKVLMKFSTDDVVYGRSMYGILFAFITFFGQDHLKRRLAQLNADLDRGYTRTG